MADLDEQLRRTLRRLMRQQGRTQATVAAQVGRNQPWISRYFSGRFNADLGTLERIAAVFDQSLAGLLSMPPDPQEARLVEHYRRCDPEQREMLLAVAASFADAPPPVARKRRRSRGRA
jgi:transcriptional regulator with XRE-family HTH domain